MGETKLQILRTLNRPDAILSVVCQSAQIQIAKPQTKDIYMPLQGAEGGPFGPDDYVPLVAAGCIIPAVSLGFNESDEIYRLWDLETAARAQGTQA